MVIQTITVEEENSHQRLDVFLAKTLEDIPSRTFIKRLIDSGDVQVNQKHVNAHYKILKGDIIIINLPEPNLSLKNVEPEDIPLDIFYEDAYLLIINKPAGMLVHPAHGRYNGTLVNALLHYCRIESNGKGDNPSNAVTRSKRKTLSSVNAHFRPGIVHRLDRETSGLICVAKDDRTHVRLARQFEKHRVKKRYAALVKGEPEFDEGIIDAPLGRHPRHWDKKSVAFDDLAKEAKTFYRVIKRFEGQITLVALFPQSGRTHQLRVHMAYLGHPILGDDKYGKKDSFSRLALHAQVIGFHHPMTKQFVEFSSPLPAEFLVPLA